MLSTLHKRRLLKLARFLEKLPPKKFNLSLVMKTQDKDHIPTVAKFPNCGAVACAMGWCPIVFPTLARYIELGPDWQGRLSADVSYMVHGVEVEDYDGAEAFFGLRNFPKDVYWLFNPTSYPQGQRNAKNVVARIREYVKANGEVDNADQIDRYPWHEYTRRCQYPPVTFR